MDFVSENEIERVRKKLVEAREGYNAGKITAPALIGLSHEFTYYMIAGNNEKTIMECVSVAASGGFVAVKLVVTEDAELAFCTGDLFLSDPVVFTETLESLREEFAKEFINARSAA